MSLPDPNRPALLVFSTVNRNALVTALGRNGWNAIGSRSFDEPIERMREDLGEGAIVDLRDDGPAGLAAIRALGPLVRVLAIVPGRDIKWIAAAIDAGAAAYLTSPFPQVELVQAARLALPRATLPVAIAAGSIPEGAGALDAIERRVARGAATVLLIAATRFDGVNAAYGRAVGDELLSAVAGRIGSAVRAIDPAATIVRVSGAEFAALVPPRMGEPLAHEIVARLTRPFVAGGHIIAIGCRVGLVDAAAREDATTVLRRASAALADARSGEGANVRSGTADAAGAALFDATLDADLRRALERDQIDIVYQPQVDIASGAVVGVEALARWQHPVHGELGAATLFAVAARSDYLGALSAHIQRCALRIAAAWPHELDGLRLSVNVTAGDIAERDFVACFLAMVGESGFERTRLTVEVTESGLIDDLAGAAEMLAALRAAGVRVAIDDFGTGYSSLAYLKALPLDYLKIDKGLAQDIAGRRATGSSCAE